MGKKNVTATQFVTLENTKYKTVLEIRLRENGNVDVKLRGKPSSFVKVGVACRTGSYRPGDLFYFLNCNNYRTLVLGPLPREEVCKKSQYLINMIGLDGRASGNWTPVVNPDEITLDEIDRIAGPNLYTPVDRDNNCKVKKEKEKKDDEG
jgi:hypothetical protein